MNEPAPQNIPQKKKKKKRRPQHSSGGAGFAVSRGKVSRHPRIAIIGFRGIGKSGIAVKLSALLGLPSVSLDERIEKKMGMTIGNFVAANGWEAFREREAQVLKEITDERVLLDTGGGILEAGDGSYSEEKAAWLKEHFFVIYVTMPDDRILARLRSARKSEHRPGLQESDEEVLARRKPWYRKTCHMIVDISDANSREAARRIADMLA